MVCTHGEMNDQFCIYCLRKRGDDLDLQLREVLAVWGQWPGLIAPIEVLREWMIKMTTIVTLAERTLGGKSST